MSKLYFSESGRVVPSLCEEVTTFRRARKVLTLPSTAGQGTLHVLVRPYTATTLPLRIAVNETELACIEPSIAASYRWHEAPIEPKLLVAGENTFDLWSDATAMNSWSLAIESGHANPNSWLSDNGGATWRNECMSYLNCVRGEYVVRVRLAEGYDAPPPPMIFESANHPRYDSLRRLMPREVFSNSTLIDRVRSLSSWVSTSWKHHGVALGGELYACWDPETILAWGRSLSGHNGRPPIVNCVHYSIVFVMCAQAAGILARCVALQGDVNGLGGHFVSEVWSDDHGKWFMVDPNLDALFVRDGVPMSIREIQQLDSRISRFVQWGPGTKQRVAEWRMDADFEHHDPFDRYLNGTTFRHSGLWHRADFLSHPELTPPGHGTLSYCEAGLIW